MLPDTSITNTRDEGVFVKTHKRAPELDGVNLLFLDDHVVQHFFPQLWMLIYMFVHSGRGQRSVLSHRALVGKLEGNRK